MKTWMQETLRPNDTPTTHSDDEDAEWLNPEAQFHLHLGRYNNRKQITLIMAGKPYTFASTGDILGKRIATGTLEEMQALYEVYVRML